MRTKDYYIESELQSLSTVFKFGIPWSTEDRYNFSIKIPNKYFQMGISDEVQYTWYVEFDSVLLDNLINQYSTKELGNRIFEINLNPLKLRFDISIVTLDNEIPLYKRDGLKVDIHSNVSNDNLKSILGLFNRLIRAYRNYNQSLEVIDDNKRVSKRRVYDVVRSKYFELT